MKILIVGGGNVGSALGLGWLKHGHDVHWAVPEPASAKYPNLPKERLGTMPGKVDADVVVLAIPYAAAGKAAASLGSLSGRIVIDCTNPLTMGPDGLQLVVGHENSGAETIAKLMPGASVFKTLNQTGAENMADAAAYHPKPVMFVAGDNAAQKPKVMTLVSDLGFQSVDAGPLKAARLLEPLAMLWIDLAMKRGHARDFTLAIVRHPKSPKS